MVTDALRVFRGGLSAFNKTKTKFQSQILKKTFFLENLKKHFFFLEILEMSLVHFEQGGQLSGGRAIIL